jgi:hypothetical protein
MIRIKFVGVGDAYGISEIHERPTCPRVDEEVCFHSTTWSVRTIVHYLDYPDFDVYCVVGPPNRRG